MDPSTEFNWYDQSAGAPGTTGGENPANTPWDAPTGHDEAAMSPAWADLGIPRPSAFADEADAPMAATEGQTPEGEASAGAGTDGAGPATAQGAGARLATDARYRTAILKMQEGAWPEAVELFASLRASYPDVAVLAPLHNEAQLRAHLVLTWEDQVRGRKLTVKQQRRVRRALPFMALLVLFMGSLGFYQVLIAPSRQVLAMENANQRKVEEAQGLFQNRQYQEALTAYVSVLSADPTNQGALAGKAEAENMLALAAEYNMAIEMAEQGNVERAMAFLTSIQERAPSFRDVGAQIEKLQGQIKARELFVAAEAAYQDQRWLEAVDLYKQAGELAGADKAPIIEQYLQAAYLPAAVVILSQRPTEEFGPKEAEEFLNQAAQRDPATAQAELTLLNAYFEGESAYRAGELTEAANFWRAVYDARPGYLGGLLANGLYDIYLEMATQAEKGRDTNYAASVYQLAIGLQGVDTYEATTRLAGLAPTPTPEPPTPEPEEVYDPPAAAAAPAAPAAPTPEPDPRLAYLGWIAFRTNRGGMDEVFIMRPDGTEQQPAPDAVRAKFDELTRVNSFTADNTRELFVGVPDGRSDANIYMRTTDANGGVRDDMQTDLPGDDYEPAWAPAGDHFAFVSNATGNDEIWVAWGPGDLRQLTFNEWEWDKHPTWSPDGVEIAFYSNRTGQRQIWVMNAEGAGQRNISQNMYEDWDPIWIK